jgi:hypothetical protein
MLATAKVRHRLLPVLALSAPLLLAPGALGAQVQIRFGDPARANYSELHEALREGTPLADTVVQLLAAKTPAPLWARFRAALAGKVRWNDGLVALTRIAMLRDPKSADSAARYRKKIRAGILKTPPTIEPADLLPVFHAIDLESARARRGDLAVLDDLLPRVPAGRYDLGDAWVFGRLGAGAADSVAARFLSAKDQALRIRYLTLMSFSTDSSLIPLLTRIYAAPDSFGLPPRVAIRASDGLIWIGTRRSMQALLDARAVARSRGIYADPRLNHADLDFLGSDSSAVISRTGRWLTEWIARLP